MFSLWAICVLLFAARPAHALESAWTARPVPAADANDSSDDREDCDDEQDASCPPRARVERRGHASREGAPRGVWAPVAMRPAGILVAPASRAKVQEVPPRALSRQKMRTRLMVFLN